MSGLGTLVSLLCLQSGVPVLMMHYQMRSLSSFATQQNPEFRIIGFFLYLYSLRNMYQNAMDECRSTFLELAFLYDLDWGFIWPVLLGEIVNSFASFTLSLTLFKVFCDSIHPQDLIINCIAINFIGSVDSEFTDPEMRARAIETFKHVMHDRMGAEVMEESCMRQAVEFFSHYTLLALRLGGTVVLGHVLAFLFLVSHEQVVCDYAPLLCIEKLCWLLPVICIGEDL